MAPPPLGDEEAQVKKREKLVAKPAWLIHNGESSAVIFTVVTALLVQLLSGYKSVEELDNILTISLGWILFMVYILAGIVMVFKRDISDRVRRDIPPTRNQKITLMSLNLLTDTAFMAANVVFLGMVDKSYLALASIPALGFILVVVLFYFDLKSVQSQGEGGTEYNESMVKNCFKVGNAATSAGYLVQTTVCIGYLKYPKFQKDHTNQYILILPFLTSCVGSFARTVTSSPLQFQSERMCRFLKQITNAMLVLLGLAVVFTSAEFLDAMKVIFAVIIPFSEMFVVNLWQKSLKQKATDDNLASTENGEEFDAMFVAHETDDHSTSTEDGEEVDSMFVALAGFGTVVLSAVYSVKFFSEGHTTYLTWSVFFLLLSTISSLMRMAYLFRPACTVIKYVNDVLPIVETLVGLALLLIEICTYITKVSKAGESIPFLGPISSFHR